MSNRFAAQMTCAVCGARLPVLSSKDEYVEKGCGVRLPDGSYRFFCIGRHTKEEIDTAIHRIKPTFTTGLILKKRQKLI
jgi:hypothetical protein